MMVDYHDFTSKDMPKVERNQLGVGDIWINAAECPQCGEVVRSRNRHDFRYCQCGTLAVDGGSFYLKRMISKGYTFDDIIEHSESFSDVAQSDEE